MGAYSLWMFDNVPESAGLFVKVATDEVSFEDIASTFTEVTGKKGIHQSIPIDDFLTAAEPYPNAPANWAAGPNAHRDESSMTWRENFRAWWIYWGEGGITAVRDQDLMHKMHPKRIRSLREWMEKVGYDGKPRPILKSIEDLRRMAAAQESNA